MAVRRIRQRQTLSGDDRLLLISQQQRAVALIVFRTPLRQQMLVRTQKRMLDLPLNLRCQTILLIEKPGTALPRRRAVGQAVQWIVAIDAEYGSVRNSHGVIPLMQRCGSQSGLTICRRPASRTARCWSICRTKRRRKHTPPAPSISAYSRTALTSTE
ncbi:hypothetical protein ALQ16_203147 [Pseudomonas syringae pv. actinidiae]|uniref:Predicted Zn-dependent protease or its inactivated homolog n=1 Tax=Pseudomonas syringae pv. actinidiae TaxID=103796 RepID=A0AAN4QC98_PSESF|nr:hypothetical protein ALQ16_203147 [Pseudomonas syringae pv. actinidiae]GBH21006.1 Predicted Zn-dependent protease or its inactivated homolog [Pseudomonas syringae pv. actinidiae]